MNIIERIKEHHPLQEYIENLTGKPFKSAGAWKDIGECPFCSGHDCARISPDGNFYCFQCYSFAPDSIKFRSLFDNITYKEAIDKFKDDMGIKKYDRRDIDWISLRESTCEYLRETLFTCMTKYQFKGENLTPIRYLTDIRQHSYEAILNFRIGFNDGKLSDYLEKEFSKETIKASGISVISEGSFAYPFMVDNEIKYFRIKDPNKLKRQQMAMSTRSKNSFWYNQGVIQEGKEIFVCEGEDDVVSLWDYGVDAVASCGTLTMNQINYLKTVDLNCVYSCFDGDATGKRDTDLLSKNYENVNMFVVKIPEDKDVDDIIREVKDKETLIQNLKTDAEAPSPEMRSAIKQKPDGYYILKISKNGMAFEKRITNWTLDMEAVIIRDEERTRKVRVKSGNYQETIYMPGVFSSVSKLREFLYNRCNKLLYFMGTDYDLSSLVQYWEAAFNPKIVKESDCVGEIEEGFIAENVFVANNGEFKSLTDGFLNLDDSYSIRIVELVRRGGARSEVPYFPLTEPSGGIEAFKKNIFSLMIKNRNLKIAIGIGWMKAVLWSKMFYEKKKFFPILMYHGKYSGGKSVFANWLMSMVGLRDCNPEMISERGTTEVALARKLDYYSSLPVFVDDYRNDDSGQRFHTFFRGVFDRTSPTKGLKEEHGVRRVRIRGCLLLTGETCPTDPALLSRLISIELTRQERSERYFKELRAIEPKFACIGLDWLRTRVKSFPEFIGKYEEIEGILSKKIDDPRQASVWAVCVAGALTEPVFNQNELIEFSSKLANMEIAERRGEELIGTLWDAADVLHKRNKLDRQMVNYNSYDKQIEVHINSLLSEISGNPATRKYQLPNNREVAKILKQEPYVLMLKNTRVDGKVAKRWILDLKECPEVLKSMFEEEEEDKNKENEGSEDI